MQEARWLLAPLELQTWIPRDDRPVSGASLLDAAGDLAVLLIEDAGERRAVSPRELAEEERFWTIDSAFFRSAEEILRELPGDASLSALGGPLGGTALAMPSDPVLCGWDFTSPLSTITFAGKEVAEIKIDEDQRRVDLCWMEALDPSRWLSLVRDRKLFEEMQRNRRFSAHPSFRDEMGNVLLEREGVRKDGSDGWLGARAFGRIYLFQGSELVGVLKHLPEAEPGEEMEAETARATTATIISDFAKGPGLPRDVSDYAERALRNSTQERAPVEVIKKYMDFDQLCTALEATAWRVFDTSAWMRTDPEEY